MPNRVIVRVLCDLSCHVSEALAVAFEDAGPPTAWSSFNISQ